MHTGSIASWVMCNLGKIESEMLAAIAVPGRIKRPEDHSVACIYGRRGGAVAAEGAVKGLAGGVEAVGGGHVMVPSTR